MNNYIELNKKVFLDFVNDISEDRFSENGKEKLIKWLTEKSDFFTAPASTKYHSNIEGGLCIHSITVYKVLKELVESYLPKDMYSEDTLKLVGLFHDISKANYYEKSYRNVKNNQTNQWEQVEEYRVKSADDRFIYGNHEETSEFMLRSFVNLKPEESTAILHHHGGRGFDSSQIDISLIFGKSGLSLLLHLADMIATFIIENKRYEY